MAVIDEAKGWRDQDPDAETRAELDDLITRAEGGDETAVADLHSRFDARLEFGTAGLRGALAAGPNRMNRVLVAQAAAGFAAYLLGRPTQADGPGEIEPGVTGPSVVIGYDGRKNSRVFATDTAELMAGAGVRAIILPRLLPTPVLAFAVRHLNVSAGVMVTASHNPPNDNGYKVYLGDADSGSQIVPPADAEIEAQIQLVAATKRVPDLPRSLDYETAGEEVLDEYVRLTAGLVRHPPAALKFVYTAMHGVGWETARRVFIDSGFGEPSVVMEQIEPDPAFPTVAFPNPEEPGALDLAFNTATAVGAELIIANDPDADRLAVAVPVVPVVPVTTGSGSSPDTPGWRRLSGNEVGSLLGWRAAERSGPDAVLASSLVSSPALAEIAAQYHLAYEDTLTGFKWVSRVAGLGFGYEEALGYLVDPAKVRDKDGISAAVEFLALVSELKSRGKTIDDHQLDFAAKFGAFASGQVSVRVNDAADILRVMGALRSNPPSNIGDVAVAGIDDFSNGFGRFAPSDILRIRLEDGSRVIVRPSGTEPKVKVYLDASSAVGTPAERIAAAQAKVDALDAAVRPLLS